MNQTHVSSCSQPRRTRISRAIVVLSIALIAFPASAFKIDSHIWIAQQVLNDLADDGLVEIPGFGSFPISTDLKDALLRYQNEFRMGSVGPDAFPDLVGGQLTTHPGEPGAWKTDEWLRLVVSRASTPRERAFVYGFLSHAAADIFAHTYVNLYSGDIFDFDDGPEEELRHMALEDFIRGHMPPLLGSTNKPLINYESIQVPAQFVRDTLIMNQTVADLYRADWKTAYLAQMYDFWVRLDGMVKKAQAVERSFKDRIGGVNAQINSIKNKKIKICLPWPWNNTCASIKPYDYYCFGCKWTACSIWDVWGCQYVNLCSLFSLDPVTCSSVDALQATLDATQASLDVFTAGTLAPLTLWRDAVARAVLEYVNTSQKVAHEIMRGPYADPPGDPLGAVRDWVACWGPAFAGVPSVVSTGVCSVTNFISDISGGIESFRETVSDRLGVVGWLVDPMQKTNELAEDLKPAAEAVGLDLAGALLGEDSLAYSLASLRLARHSDRSVTDQFSSDSSKGLLVIPDIVQRLRADMFLDENHHFSPEKFAPVRNAIVLTKLLLLEPSQINDIVRAAGIQRTAYGDDLYSPIYPFSVLFGAVQSIDGSHQWQPSAPPYPRQPDHTDEAFEKGRRTYGRAFDDGGGFRLWQDCAVYQRVFLQLFIGPIAPALEDAAFIESKGLEPIKNHYPSDASESNPFPAPKGVAPRDLVPPTPVVNPLPVISGECPLQVTGAPQAVDMCQGPLTGATSDKLSFSSAGSFSVHWRYDDGMGNVSQPQTQLIQVLDTTPPSLDGIPSEFRAEQASRDGTAVALPTTAPDACEGPVAIAHDAPSVFPLGTTAVTLRARDASGNESLRVVDVTISDTTAPQFVSVPAPVTLEQTSLAGTAFTLPPAQAFDICDAAPAVDSDAPAVFPLGANTVTVRATDASGNVASATTRVTIQDTTPPVLASVIASPPTIWSPNHGMVSVAVMPHVSDVCDVAPECHIESVTSNEPINGTADANTIPDWSLSGDLQVELRAERQATGTGRIYTIGVRCTDASGNSVTGSTDVTVARDQSDAT